MRKLSLCTFVALALLVTAAVAQSSGRGSQGSMSQPGQQQPGYGQQQPGSAQPDSSAQGQTDQNNPSQNKMEKSEKKLKGCVQSQGGQYVLETKKGKAVSLTGQDVSAHVGHEVSVKGTWESSGGAGSAASTSSAGGSEKTFNVASVDMISDSCGGKAKSSGSMGASPSGTGSNSGSSGSSTGTGNTQPPQSQPPQ